MALAKGYQQLLDEALAQVTTLHVDEARALHGRDDVVFVDVRDVRELESEGVLPGAVHAPRGMLEFWIEPASPCHREVFAREGAIYVLLRWAGARRWPPRPCRTWGCRRWRTRRPRPGPPPPA